jgi:hypothetical protein
VAPTEEARTSMVSMTRRLKKSIRYKKQSMVGVPEIVTNTVPRRWNLGLQRGSGKTNGAMNFPT